MNKDLEMKLHTGNCIRTYTGLYMDVFAPTEDMICIEDIAHALSNMPRFAGHTSEFYSVAQHCISCFHLFNAEEDIFDPLLGLEILMHDSTEAYLLDMPKPIKRLLPEYNVLEEKLMKLIFNKFGLTYPLNPEVKRIDKVMLEWEFRQFMVQDSIFTKVLTPKEAEKEFLRIYHLEMKKILVSL